MDPIHSTGFVFEVIDPRSNQLKGYLVAADHSADSAMLQILKNTPLKSAFNNATNVFFENINRYLADIDELSDEKGVSSFAANILRLDNNPEPFAKLLNIPPPDMKLGKIMPGVDYHLLAKSIEEKGIEHVHSLEKMQDDQQQTATSDYINIFKDNLASFISDIESLKTSTQPPSIQGVDITKAVKERNEACSEGNLDKFYRSQQLLDGDFFSKERKDDDPNKSLIAFGRNRDVNLAKVVHTILTDANEPILIIFGTSHLLSTDSINISSLLKAKGWIIKQIK